MDDTPPLTPQTDQSPQPETLQEWFESIPDSQPPKKSRKIFVIGGCVALLIVAGVVSGLVLLPRTPACLTQDDYKTLIGTDPDGTISPRNTFYTFLIHFEKDGKTYAPANDPSANDIASAIAAFSRKHPHTSLLMTIDSSYSQTGDKVLAEARIATLARQLTTAGVPQASIQSNAPSFITPEDTAESSTATISLRSAATCQEK